MAKTKYNDTFPLLVEDYARSGLNDEQIASKLGINPSTYYDYQKKYPKFSEAIKRGKEPVDIKVENTLLKRALGYDYEEKTIEIITLPNGEQRPAKIKSIKKHIPADIGAIAFWLKNRKPNKWREKMISQLNLDVTSKPTIIFGDEEEENEDKQ